jgi:molybdate transport system substrate-binding protein
MLRIPSTLLALAAGAAIVATPAAQVRASASPPGELKVFTTRAISTVLEKIGGEFERQTGWTLNVITDVAAPMVRRIVAGEPFDVLVAAPAHIDALIGAGKILPDTRADLARSGIGVAVRAGAPAPDVSSVDAFRRTLLAARSIAFLKEGQSGVYLAEVMERLGIADAIRSKLTLPETDIVSQLVSEGKVDIGIVVITQILTTDGVALAGPLPSALQTDITFTGGISAESGSIEAAKELLSALRSPAAIRVMRAQGMEPGK